MFCDKFKDLRKNSGMNQEQLADALNIHVSTISRYERGKLDPSKEHLKVISDYFNVPVSYLLGEQELALEKLYIKLKDKNIINDNMSDEELDEIVDDVANILKIIRKK